MDWQGVNLDIGVVLANVLLMVMAAFVAMAVRWVQNKGNHTGVQIAITIANAVVRAVEQMGETHGWTNSKRLEEAIVRIAPLGKQFGLNLTQEQWRTYIEQGVHGLNLAWDQITAVANAPAVQQQVVLPSDGGLHGDDVQRLNPT
jgi:hypothetical protein